MAKKRARKKKGSKVSKRIGAKKHPRKPSNKSKISKIKKLVKLAKSRK